MSDPTVKQMIEILGDLRVVGERMDVLKRELAEANEKVKRAEWCVKQATEDTRAFAERNAVLFARDVASTSYAIHLAEAGGDLAVIVNDLGADITPTQGRRTQVLQAWYALTEGDKAPANQDAENAVNSAPPVDCTVKCQGPCLGSGYCPHEEWLARRGNVTGLRSE